MAIQVPYYSLSVYILFKKITFVTAACVRVPPAYVGLHTAVRNSDAEGARKLIEQGANPDIVNLEGTTPLMVRTK